LEVFQDRQVVDTLARIQWRGDTNRAAIDGLCHARAEHVVDLVDNALGRGEVGAVGVQGAAVPLFKPPRSRTLDGGTAGNTTGRRNVDGDLRAVTALSVETAHHQVALGDGVDVAVDPLQRRQQQGTAAQALGVADGRNGDV